MRTREGIAIARAKGKLRGKQPKLSEKQKNALLRLQATGDYFTGDYFMGDYSVGQIRQRLTAPDCA